MYVKAVKDFHLLLAYSWHNSITPARCSAWVAPKASPAPNNVCLVNVWGLGLVLYMLQA